MVWSLSVRKGRGGELRLEYEAKLAAMDLQELVKEFFTYLDYTEESEGGREFHPISIGSCRVLMTQPLNMCINKLREKIK